MTTPAAYVTSSWTAIGSSQQNDAAIGGSDEDKELTTGKTVDSAWAVGGSASIEVGGGALGLANASLAVEVNGSHTWDTSVTTSLDIDVTVKPQKVVWIVQSRRDATYTGTYEFTAADGAKYQITNVTITTPAPKNDADPMTAVSYQIWEAPLNKVPGAAQGHKPTDAQLNALGAQLGYTR